VLSRLSGGTGNRVLKLITPFGGGKSHTLASLFHAARKREALDVIPEGKPLPKPSGEVNVAVFDGQFFSASSGKEFTQFKGKANTLWGWIAGCLGGQAGYELVRTADEARVAPGADDILKLLGDEPNLILLDEVLEYLISAGGIKVIDTTLRDETLNFIKRLTVLTPPLSSVAVGSDLAASHENYPTAHRPSRSAAAGQLHLQEIRT
jgi:predicted AAA+ superfamily ATPase